MCGQWIDPLLGRCDRNLSHNSSDPKLAILEISLRPAHRPSPLVVCPVLSASRQGNAAVPVVLPISQLAGTRAIRRPAPSTVVLRWLAASSTLWPFDDVGDYQNARCLSVRDILDEKPRGYSTQMVNLLCVAKQPVAKQDIDHTCTDAILHPHESLEVKGSGARIQLGHESFASER